MKSAIHRHISSVFVGAVLMGLASLFGWNAALAATVPQGANVQTETLEESDLPDWLAQVPAQEGPVVALPTEPVSMFLRYPGPRSRFQMIFSGIPEGMAVQNDVGYDGWCVDRVHDIPKNTTTPVRLYSSVDPMLPGHLAKIPRNPVNYVINHKRGTPEEVQAAIWYLTDGKTQGLTPTARALAEEALERGRDYVPKAGEILGILADPRKGLQVTVIEYPLPVVLGVEGEAPSAPEPAEPQSQPAALAASRQVLPPVFSISDPGDPGTDVRTVIIEDPGDGGGRPEDPPLPQYPFRQARGSWDRPWGFSAC